MIASQPVISVLIASRGRPQELRNCLEALSRQDFPHERYEIVVCDDGTPVPLEEQLAPTLSALSWHTTVTVVRQAQAGPAAARNCAAAVARGRFMAFTDDDCLPAPDWLATLVAHLERTPAVLIGGSLKNAVPGNPCSTATQIVMDAVYQRQAHRVGGTRFFSTSNIAMSAEAFRQLGGFSETFRQPAGEDYDFSARWQHHGRPTEYVPEAVVHHAHDPTLLEFARQHVKYGRALFRVRQMIARRSGSSFRISSPGLYLSLVPRAFGHGRGARRVVYVGLVVLSQLATLSGASYEAIVVGGAPPSDPVPLPPAADRAQE
jgi:GT2 family glycosyltransferase